MSADGCQDGTRPPTPPLPRDTANDILRRTYAEFQRLQGPHRKASEEALAGIEVEHRLEQRAQAERDDFFMTQAADRICVGSLMHPQSNECVSV